MTTENDKINGGYINLARAIQDSEVWTKPAAWLKIWLHILLNVNHKPRNGFKRGEGFFKYRDIAAQTKTTEDQVEQSARWLKRTAHITTRKTTRGIIIFVVSYAKYQDANNYKTDTETDMKTVIEPTQKRHYTQEGNKERKEKYLDCVFLTIEDRRKLEDDFGVNVTTDYIARLNDYKKAHGKKYKSDYHTILSWLRNAGIKKKMGFIESLNEEANELGLKINDQSND